MSHPLLGSLTCTRAVEEGWVARIAGLLQMSETSAKNRLLGVHGKTLVRNAFGAAWPSLLDELATLTVMSARSYGLRDTICGVTGLSRHAVTRRLNGANGKTLLRNLFVHDWPTPGRQPTQKIAPLGPGAQPGKPCVGPISPRPKGPAASGLRPGSLILDRYRVTMFIASGGFADVYEACDTRLDGEPVVVLKFGRNEASHRDEMQREFGIARDLGHPNLCRYFHHDVDTRTGRPFLVLQHAGKAIGALIEERDSLLSSKNLNRITRDAAVALDFLHAKHRIIHGDVSPGNILVDSSGAVRLTDFGVSRRGTVESGTIMLGSTMGGGYHRVYSAPEVLDTGHPRRASDQYSLALVFCSMMERQIYTTRFKAHAIGVLNKRQNQAVARALATEHAARFGSCMEFIEALGA